MMSWLTIHILPIGSIAWRVNLQTAILAGVAVVCLSKVVLRLYSIIDNTVQLPKTDNAWDKPIWLVLRGVGFRKF